jgi:hypothetical protein
MWNTRKEHTLSIGIQLKGTVAQDSSVANFFRNLFYKSTRSGHLLFSNFSKIRRDIRELRCLTGVNDTVEAKSFVRIKIISQIVNCSHSLSMFLTIFFLVKHVLPVRMTPVRFVVIFRGLLLSSINASGEALLTGASDTGETIEHLVGVTPPVAWIPISTTLHHGNGEEPKLFNI